MNLFFIDTGSQHNITIQGAVFRAYLQIVSVKLPFIKTAYYICSLLQLEPALLVWKFTPTTFSDARYQD